MSPPGNPLVPADSKKEIDPKKMEAELKDALTTIINSKQEVKEFFFTNFSLRLNDGSIYDGNKYDRIDISYKYKGDYDVRNLVSELLHKPSRCGRGYLNANKGTSNWFCILQDQFPGIVAEILAESDRIKKAAAQAANTLRASKEADAKEEGKPHPVLGEYSHTQPAQQVFLASAAAPAGGDRTTAVKDNTAVVTPSVVPAPP